MAMKKRLVPDSTSGPTNETERAFLLYPRTAVPSRHGEEISTRYFSPDYAIVFGSTGDTPSQNIAYSDVDPREALFQVKNRTDVPLLSQLEFDSEALQHQEALEEVEQLLRSVFGEEASLRFEEDWNEDYDRVESVIQMQVPYGREDDTLEELFNRYQEFIKRYVATIPAETRSRIILEPHPIEK